MTIIMPIIRHDIGKSWRNDLVSITLEVRYSQYGNFIQAVINFIIIAFVLFLVIKAMNSYEEKRRSSCACCHHRKILLLLREIRDALKK